jgi:hypothetical protein
MQQTQVIEVGILSHDVVIMEESIFPNFGIACFVHAQQPHLT